MPGLKSLITIVMAVVVAGADFATAAPAWQRFIHPTLGFSLSYPKGWDLVPPSESIAAMVVGQPPAGVSGLRLNVNVTTDKLPARVNVEEYEEANEAQIRLLFQGYRRLRTDRLQVGGTPAILRYYTWKRNDGVELYQIQLMVVAGGRGYVVTGTTGAASRRLQDEAQLLVGILVTFRPRR